MASLSENLYLGMKGSFTVSFDLTLLGGGGDDNGSDIVNLEDLLV